MELFRGEEKEDDGSIYHIYICTVLKVDGATPKRWISKGP